MSSSACGFAPMPRRWRTGSASRSGSREEMATSKALDRFSAIVTGGGTGIGAACAERLVADGVTVTICGRTESTLAQTIERIEKESLPGRIGYVVADVTGEHDVER